MKTLRALLVLTLLALIASPALAQPQGGVPIKGSVTGVDYQLDPSGVCAPIPVGSDFDETWRYRSVGTGVLSHLGRVSFVVEHCTYFDVDTGTGIFNEGTTTFVAANGDTLVLSHSGTFEVSTEGPFALVNQDWTVEGGTGRFVGAEGHGTANPVSDFISGTTTATWTGVIEYDASNVRN
jgi:hypothetical protein